MKNLLDKPYKTVSKIFTITLMSMMIISGDSSLHKTENRIEPTPIEVVVVIPTEPVVIETPPEVRTAITKTDKVIFSRGGSPIKKLSERDVINSYVRDIAPKYNMDPELIMSMIVSESDYNPKATTGKCLGLMQVSSRWHKERAARLGVTDFYDPYSNILLGVDYLSELQAKYKDMRLVLMLYNMEHDTAIRLYKNGQISNYAKTIIARAEQYKKGE